MQQQAIPIRNAFKRRRISPSNSLDMSEDSESQKSSSSGESTTRRLREDLQVAEEEYRRMTQKGGAKSSLTLRERLLLIKTDEQSKMTIMRRYEEIYGSAESTENAKTLLWLNMCLQMPFGKLQSLGILKEDGTDKISQYLMSVMNTMELSVYGHVQAKEDILCFIARMIANPIASSGKVLALWGPAGCGKTRLVKQAMHKGLGLPFFSINCGGLSDSSLLLGHSYTYVGSKPGKIAQILSMSNCANCIIYLDEVDKLAGSKKSEISGVLTHLLDPEQNTQFQDNYFQGINIDVSHVLFVLSFNDLDKVDVIARDRMKIIKVEGNNLSEKIQIAQKFVVPEVLHSLSMNPYDVVFTEPVLAYIINRADEVGMRKCRRYIEGIIEKINLSIITGSTLSFSFGNIAFRIPMTLTLDTATALMDTDD